MSATVQLLNTATLRKNIPTGGVRALLDEIEALKAQLKNQSELIESLEEQTSQDGLTGLLNRRGFDMSLKNAVADYQRYGRNGALLLIDMNDFKQVNDTLGHQAGDAVLLHVAKLLMAHTRRSDIVARIGGDEFCVILQEASTAEAHAKRKELEAVIAGTVCAYQEQDISTSCSIGVATFIDADDQEALIAKADAEMYRVKAQHHGKRN